MRLVDSIRACGAISSWASLRLMCLVFHQSRLLESVAYTNIALWPPCYAISKIGILQYVCRQFGSAACAKPQYAIMIWGTRDKDSRNMSLPRARVLTLDNTRLGTSVEAKSPSVIAKRGWVRFHGRWLWPISRIAVQRNRRERTNDRPV